jgi:hypothetical protein
MKEPPAHWANRPSPQLPERAPPTLAEALAVSEVAALVEALQFYSWKEICGIRFAGGCDGGHRARAALTAIRDAKEGRE